MNVDMQPYLSGQLVTLRPLQADDYSEFFRIASDPAIWDQHPSWDRYQDEVCKVFFEESLASGGCLLVFDAKTQEAIGSSRFFGHDPVKQEIEIGWTFLAKSHWGGKYNGELKSLMLGHAFNFVESVVFFVGPHNYRSQRALEKIGISRTLETREAGSLVFRIDKSVYQSDRTTKV